MKPSLDDPVINIRHDPRPGDMGTILKLHGELYDKEYGYDHTFEAYVAGPMAEFVMNRSERDRLWVVEQAGEVKGSIAIAGSGETVAQLRWFLLHPDLRGRGIGKTLVKEAVDFSRRASYKHIFLWTVAGLDAAIALYKSAGFELAETKSGTMWGLEVVQEKYEMGL